MLTVTARPLRLKCDYANPNHVLDAETGSMPSVPRGAALVVQVGLFARNAIVADTSNLDSATLKIRALTESNGVLTIGAVQASSAVAAGDIVDITEAQWNAGTHQHAEFELTSAQLNLAAGTYWLVLAGQTTAGETITIGVGRFRIVDVGLTDDAAEAPEFLPSDGPTCKRGSVTLSTNDETKAVAFTTAFAAAPSLVLVTLHAPSSGFVIGAQVDADPTAAGFTARFAAPIPATGYKLKWLAIL